MASTDTYSAILTVVQFTHDWHWVGFRYAEFDACIELAGINPRDVYDIPYEELQSSPFLIARFPDEMAVRTVCSRSVLVKAVYELWATGRGMSALKTDIGRAVAEERISSKWRDEAVTWSIAIEPYAKSFTSSQQQSFREIVGPLLGFRGHVQLHGAQAAMSLLLDYSGSPNEIGRDFDTLAADAGCYLGRHICNSGMRDELQKYSLKTRIYLGPTSLDTSLAFMMTNLGHVKQSSIVLDPFVGTASILVSATHHGKLINYIKVLFIISILRFIWLII